MATQPEDDEPLDLTDELEPDDEPEGGEDDIDPNVNDEGDGETVVEFEGEEPEAESDNSVIRQMRQELREARKELAEARKASAPKPVDVGEKPTLAGCEFDEERFETELDEWKDRKAAADRQERQRAETEQAVNESWSAAKQRYETKAAEYGFDDIKSDEAAVDLALGALSPVILKAANDPAAMIRGLGRSPAKLAELAKLKDPFELAAAVARMEGAVKVTKGRKAPAPDKPLTGSVRMPGGVDKKLEELERKAEKSGDRTALVAYKKQLRAKGK